ncbi:XRE family transcriptional regulator [Micromonospora craterilacus]|uniref:XRE family transcriptional regulator n=1 Tax=Micromonospora craterilacus TaxID=1655439 RepID=A0A2W2D6X0_9ACTN|nr:helix-turn-helix transcriptional regulator [Micromonospora craterilacus]PZG07716.1 XRE family transcriptional regulator [Micromonospora craterilacus]
MNPQQLSEVKRALGRRLAGWRRTRGLTQDDVARRVHSTRSTVANVESGRQVVDRVFWVQCESLLNAGGDLIAGYDDYRSLEVRQKEEKAEAARHARWGAVLDHQTLVEASSPNWAPDRATPAAPAGCRLTSGACHDRSSTSRPGADLQAVVDDVDGLRRSLNEALSLGPITVAGLDEWERIVTHHGRATRDRSADMLLREIAGDLTELREVIGRRPSASALRRLTGMAAQMSGLMCLVLCRIDERAAAQRWARTARLAAVEAGHPVIQSWVLAQEAHVYYYSADFDETVNLARHAQEVAGQKASVGTVLAAAIEARALAATGRREETRAALGRAEEFLSHLEGDALSHSAFGYSEAQLRFHEENAYTLLGDLKAALAAQDRALELGSPGDYTDWALTRLDRATCLTKTGHASDALDSLAETIGSLDEAKRQGIIAERACLVLDALPAAQRSSSTARDLRALLTMAR